MFTEPAAEPGIPAGASAPPGISVIVCCYTEERWDDIMAALGSLRRQSVAPREVVVVVDHRPELLARLRTALTAEIVVENAFGRGLSGGRNTGIRVATGEVVAFLDDDAVAEEHWIERLGAEYADPGVIAAGGRTDPWWERRAPGWFPAEFGWVVGFSYRGLPTSRATVRNVFGGNMSIRRDVVTGLGGFREGIGRAAGRPLGCEETELCIRAGRSYPDAGIVYQPGAVIRHRVPAARATFRYFCSRCYAEGLSKAAVARLAGSGRALSTERSYVSSTLRRAALACLRTGITGDGDALRRAAAIVVGLGATCWGYAVGWSTARVPARGKDADAGTDSRPAVPLGR